MLLDGIEDITTFGSSTKCSCKSRKYNVPNSANNFSPTFFNAVAGLATTVINIYTARNGDWSIMAVLTACITATVALAAFVLIIIYQFGKLEKLKQDHIREFDASFRMVGVHTSRG